MLARIDRSRRAFVHIFALGFATLLLTGCPCPGTKQHSHSVAHESAYQGTGNAPVIYGRVRFDGTVAHLDVKVVDGGSAPYADYMEVSWTSHDETEPPAFGPPLDLTNPESPAKAEWSEHAIDASYTATKKWFHVKIKLKSGGAGGVILGSVTDRTFPIAPNTDWKQFP
jgi:hypothetical protein